MDGKQGTLWNFSSPDMPATVPVADTNIDARDIHRLSSQSLEILARLRKGPATNMELARITHRFSARIHDLRAAGYDIETIRGEGGLNTSRLNGEPKP